MNKNLDIIDRLDGEDGFVELVFKSGVTEYGTPLGITYLDDENGVPTRKRILFKPFFGFFTQDYGLEDIDSYLPVKKDDIPPHE